MTQENSVATLRHVRILNPDTAFHQRHGDIAPCGIVASVNTALGYTKTPETGAFRDTSVNRKDS